MTQEIKEIAATPTPPVPAQPQMLQSGTSGVRGHNPYLIPLAIVAAAFIIGVFVLIGITQTAHTSAPTQQAAAAANVNVKNINTQGLPYIGDPKAPVTLVYWSDYQCPFCKAFEVGGVPQINSNIPPAMPQIIKQYVDTGKVRVVFEEFPFLGNDSITAAEYAYAIWSLYPQQFYQWRVAMFKAQDQEGDVGFGNAKTIDALIASQFSQFNLAKINQLIATNKEAYVTEMNKERAAGEALGINGTPGFVTGTKLIGGDAPFATFSAAIDTQL